MKSKPGLQSKLPYPKTQTDFPSTFILVSVRVIKEMEWIIDNENLFIGEKGKKERMSLSAVKSIFGGRDEKSTHISSSSCLFSSKRGKKYFSFKIASSHTFFVLETFFSKIAYENDDEDDMFRIGKDEEKCFRDPVTWVAENDVVDHTSVDPRNLYQ